MFILELIIQCLFFTVCGCIGHVFVKLITFGKLDLEWGPAAESTLTDWIGFFVVLFVAGGIASMVHH